MCTVGAHGVVRVMAHVGPRVSQRTDK